MPKPFSLPTLTEDHGLAAYLAEIKTFPLLEKEEEYMLAKRWVEHKDSAAAHSLVTSHLRLATKIAMGYRGYGLPITDVISEANVGLMQAVKRFDPEKGFRLATYAVWWIRANVQEYILRSWSLVKTGTTRSQKKLFFNLRKAKRRIGVIEENLSKEQAREIAQNLNVHEKEVLSMEQRLSARDGSLNVKVGNLESESGEMQDFLVDENADHVGEIAEQQENKARQELLTQALDVLNEREADILTKRRLSDSPCTLETLSRVHKVSRERIRQIEERAYQRVRERVLELAQGKGMYPA